MVKKDCGIILKVFTITFFPCLIISCNNLLSNKGVAEQANDNFETQFNTDVKKINSFRVEPKRTAIERSDFVSADRNLSKNPQQLENFSPDERVFRDGQQMMMKSQFAGDIFDLNYDTNPQGPFVVRGAEFDSIQIPEADFYGVKSSLSAKQYLLVGNKALQKNIDTINDKKVSYDDELSAILVKEQKELQRQKRFNELFEYDTSVLEEKRIKKQKEEEDEKLARAERLKNQDPIKKIIALQIIEENKRNNAPPTDQQQQNQNK